MKQEYRIKEIERELEQFRQEAENAHSSMKQLDLSSRSPSWIHQWKDSFEEGLHRIRTYYFDEYMQLANDIPIAGINAREAILSCIDCLTRKMISRSKLTGERT